MDVLKLNTFIHEQVLSRSRSLFEEDLDKHKQQLSKEIKNKRVLVIGGAGTIGSSYIKALLPFQPRSLMVVDYSENGLTELTRDLRSQNIYMPTTYITYPFDFGSPVFEKMFLANQFDIIACFAAHKHVRSEKDHFAIEAMIQNNVFNTQRLLKLASINKPNHFFSVSTDKATNPVNVMGATKKLMEQLLLSYSDVINIATARFANVAFSNGSLLEGFVNRIAKRQPLSSPKDVKRYFVSPIESGQLCLLSSILGENGDIFFPKLSETSMINFANISDRFIRFLGLEPYHCQSEEEAKKMAKDWKPGQLDYPVYYFNTDTSGEKKFEEFYTTTDKVDLDSYKALGVIKKAKGLNHIRVNNLIGQFQELFSNGSSPTKQDIINVLNNCIPTFNHIETGKSLDQKM